MPRLRGNLTPLEFPVSMQGDGHYAWIDKSLMIGFVPVSGLAGSQA